jgi:uncharacterized membrane protein
MAKSSKTDLGVSGAGWWVVVGSALAGAIGAYYWFKAMANGS